MVHKNEEMEYSKLKKTGCFLIENQWFTNTKKWNFPKRRTFWKAAIEIYFKKSGKKESSKFEHNQNDKRITNIPKATKIGFKK